MKELDELERLLKQLERELNQKILSKSFLNKLGKRIVKEIKDRSKKGFGVQNGKKTKYKPLEHSTKQRRRILKGQGRLSNETSPETSNQIESGKFIRGIHSRVNGETIEILPPSSREDIARFQEELGRITLELTDEDEAKIVKKVEDDIDKILDDIF